MNSHQYRNDTLNPPIPCGRSKNNLKFNPPPPPHWLHAALRFTTIQPADSGTLHAVDSATLRHRCSEAGGGDGGSSAREVSIESKEGEKEGETQLVAGPGVTWQAQRH